MNFDKQQLKQVRNKYILLQFRNLKIKIQNVIEIKVSTQCHKKRYRYFFNIFFFAMLTILIYMSIKYLSLSMLNCDISSSSNISFYESTSFLSTYNACSLLSTVTYLLLQWSREESRKILYFSFWAQNDARIIRVLIFPWLWLSANFHYPWKCNCCNHNFPN